MRKEGMALSYRRQLVNDRSNLGSDQARWVKSLTFLHFTDSTLLELVSLSRRSRLADSVRFGKDESPFVLHWLSIIALRWVGVWHAGRNGQTAERPRCSSTRAKESSFIIDIHPMVCIGTQRPPNSTLRGGVHHWGLNIADCTLFRERVCCVYKSVWIVRLQRVAGV